MLLVNSTQENLVYVVVNTTTFHAVRVMTRSSLVYPRQCLYIYIYIYTSHVTCGSEFVYLNQQQFGPKLKTSHQLLIILCSNHFQMNSLSSSKLILPDTYRHIVGKNRYHLIKVDNACQLCGVP